MGRSYSSPILRTWLATPPDNLPTVGGLLYVTVAFQPPQQAVTEGTGLYAGEQDLFAFLIDPLGWVEIEGETTLRDSLSGTPKSAAGRSAAKLSGSRPCARIISSGTQRKSRNTPASIPRE